MIGCEARASAKTSHVNRVKQTQAQEQEKGNFSFFLFLRLLHDFTRVNLRLLLRLLHIVNQALNIGVGVHIDGFDII